VERKARVIVATITCNFIILFFIPNIKDYLTQMRYSSFIIFLMRVFLLPVIILSQILHHDFHFLTHLFNFTNLLLAELHKSVFHIKLILLLLTGLFLLEKTVQLRNPLF
jgi:hypothetical protein